jgi:dihydroorotate dehydrogenase (NAD+) catalytic subunit
MPGSHQTYDTQRDYEWNYDHVPGSKLPVPDPGPEMQGDWTYAGLPVASPLAVAAGPLLNSKWIEFYAQRSFDILTYKTVRRCARVSYGLPNLVPVDNLDIREPGSTVGAAGQMEGSWAVSFGMPSRDPKSGVKMFQSPSNLLDPVKYCRYQWWPLLRKEMI